MRIMWRAWGLTALVAASLILTNGALPANDAPVVHVKAVVKDGAVRLEAQANAPFEYTTYRPSESLYVLDLSGVSAADPAGARVVASDLVKSYRVINYASGQKPVVRVEILLSQGIEPRLERKDSQDLTLLVARTDGATSAPSADKASAAAAPTSTPAIIHASAISSEAKTPGSTFESIQQVKLAQNGDQTEVNVIGSGKLTYHATKLQNPDRLVLDFTGSHLKTSQKQIASNLDPVREVRLAQFSPDVARVVIDLRQPARFNINAGENSVTVRFRTCGSAVRHFFRQVGWSEQVCAIQRVFQSEDRQSRFRSPKQRRQHQSPLLSLPRQPSRRLQPLFLWLTASRLRPLHRLPPVPILRRRSLRSRWNRPGRFLTASPLPPENIPASQSR